MKVYSLAVGIVLLGVQGPALADMPPAPAAFAQCQICHAVSASPKTGVGPNLFGVGGRKAGSQSGFAYSTAMTKSGITWTRDTLLKFIQDPQQMVPGNRMPFGGVKDPAKAKEIAEYLVRAK